MSGNRKSIRLPNFDYSSNGGYFITICTHERSRILAVIDNGHASLNSLGQMIYKEWENLINLFDGLTLGKFVVMPNHIHGIIFIEGELVYKSRSRAGSSPAPTISNVIGTFKSITTNIKILQK